jgi:hypothetical protein
MIKKLKINFKNMMLSLLCIIIILMGVGFIYLGSKITACKDMNKTFAVEVIKATAGTTIRGGSITPTGSASIVNNGKTVNFNFILNNPKDTLTYNVVIKNKGTTSAKIDNIIEVPDYINNSDYSKSIYPVVISHNDIVGSKIMPKQELTLVIKATFDSKQIAINRNINYQISILVSAS